MITFILPGYSPRNKDWAIELSKKIRTEGEVRPVFWEHWENPGKTFNPRKKAQDIIDVMLKDRAKIIAKSVGTLVAAYVTSLVPERIEKVILCGIPSVSEERKEIFKKAFLRIPPEKIVVFQNKKDPFASFAEVRSFISGISPKIKVVEKERNDHNYPYPEDFEKFLKS